MAIAVADFGCTLRRRKCAGWLFLLTIFGGGVMSEAMTLAAIAAIAAAGGADFGGTFMRYLVLGASRRPLVAAILANGSRGAQSSDRLIGNPPA